MLADDVVADEEFAEMVSAANEFRVTANALGAMGSSNVDDFVRAQLYWRAIPSLPAGQEALAKDILGVLGDSRLSAPQMAQLEYAYFPRRRT